MHALVPHAKKGLMLNQYVFTNEVQIVFRMEIEDLTSSTPVRMSHPLKDIENLLLKS